MFQRFERVFDIDSEAVRERKLRQNAESFTILRSKAANVAATVEKLAQSIQDVDTELHNINVYSKEADSQYNKLAQRAFDMCAALVYDAHNNYFEYTNSEAQSKCETCSARNALSASELFESFRDSTYVCDAKMCNRHFDYEQAASVVRAIFEDKMILV